MDMYVKVTKKPEVDRVRGMSISYSCGEKSWVCTFERWSEFPIPESIVKDLIRRFKNSRGADTQMLSAEHVKDQKAHGC